MKKYIITFSLISLFLFSGYACTTAVISGKATADGRPLLWKHRDTWFLNNKIMMFYDGKYDVVGLVNSVDTLGQSIWIGYNSAGFAIMNSASYNLNNDTIEQTGLEGRLMKKALQNCANIEEFEQMLKEMEKPSRLEANFGVIDASGGAAYFELANFEYFKFDANDPEVAPNGILIRTNYSFAGEKDKGGGYVRYKTAEKVFNEALSENNISFNTMLVDLSRNLTHSLTGVDLNDYKALPENTKTMVDFKDFIPRSGTSSSVAIQGVKSDENISLTTMWSTVGFPLTSVIIPIWLNKNNVMPDLVKYNNELADSPISFLSLELKKKIYSYTSGSHSSYYIDINTVINADNSGLLQVLEPTENEVVQRGQEMLDGWREDQINLEEMNNYYHWVDQFVFSFYSNKFNLKIVQ